MDTDFPTTALFVAARAVHFGACLLLFSAFAFDRLVALPLIANHGRLWEAAARRLVLSALPTALVSGVLWLGLNAIAMSGLPRADALRIDVVRVVLTETHFGALWEVRSVLWLATAFVAVPAVRVRSSSPFRGGLIWAALLLSGLLSLSLAWAGHGMAGGPARGHLLADALHVLTCGCWPVGLLPFGLLLRALRGTPDRRAIATMTRRFSIMSMTSVAILTLTGIVNSWILVGTVSNLTSTPYGRVLIVKVALFCATVGLGAINLVRLRPRLSVDLAEGTGTRPDAPARLQLNVLTEIILTTAVFVLVGLLGLLAPAIEAALHEHHHG